MKMRKKRIMNKIFTLILVGTLLTSASICTLASTGTYGAFTLTYKCSITSIKGTATTSGAASPYCNCAIVTVYKDSVAQGNNIAYGTNGATATASKTGLKLDMAKSCHSVTDSNRTQLLPFNKQLTATATR